MGLLRAVRAHPRRAAAVGAGAGLALAFAVYWFGPQYLFIDRRVDEALPAPAEAGAGATPTGVTQPDDGQGERDAAASPVTLARGDFRSLEHESSGAALVVEVGGSRFLRLEDLRTSNGPDLRVYLSDQPASDDWFVYDDGEFVDLGALKGNIGSSNYRIPRDVDLSGFRSAVVWCRRFAVGFAVAPLDPAT